MVNWEHDVPSLPVGIINVDRRHGRVLIELPIEADCDVNRMWMALERFRIDSGVSA